MSNQILLHNAHIVDADKDWPKGWIIIDGKNIADIGQGDFNGDMSAFESVEDLAEALLMPGVIDEHVHFREPGLEHKADIATESKAAAAGGVTSFFDMPNTKPATVTFEAWKQKMDIAAENSVINYAFYLGATNENINYLKEADYSYIPGVKLFMGNTTGATATSGDQFLEKLFTHVKATIAVHAEDETTIAHNLAELRKGSSPLPVKFHSNIRNAEACFIASDKICGLARRFNHKLHLMHVSTAKELELLQPGNIENKLITAETCPQYLLFDRSDYEVAGSRIKCNPSIKESYDRKKLIEATFSEIIDTIGTDHAPHLLKEKEGDALTAVSGMPGIQFSLPLMLELSENKKQSPCTVSRLMSANPSIIWNVKNRGFIRKGFFADLTAVTKTNVYRLTDEIVVSKCGWTPYNGKNLSYKILGTWVNGQKIFNGDSYADNRVATAVEFEHPQT